MPHPDVHLHAAFKRLRIPKPPARSLIFGQFCNSLKLRVLARGRVGHARQLPALGKISDCLGISGCRVACTAFVGFRDFACEYEQPSCTLISSAKVESRGPHGGDGSSWPGVQKHIGSFLLLPCRSARPLVTLAHVTQDQADSSGLALLGTVWGLGLGPRLSCQGFASLVKG